MIKTVVATITIDDVDLKNLDELSEALNEAVKDYEYTRIDINLSDYPMVKNTLLQG